MNEEIIALLIKRKALSDETVEIVRDLLTRGKTLEQSLVGARYVTEKDYCQAMADVFGLEFRDLEDWQFTDEIRSLLPEDTIKSYKVLPVELLEDGTFVFALLIAQDIRAAEAIQFYAVGKGWNAK